MDLEGEPFLGVEDFDEQRETLRPGAVPGRKPPRGGAVQSSCKVSPRRGPSWTTLWASSRSTISQDSPMRAPGGSFLW